MIDERIWNDALASCEEWMQCPGPVGDGARAAHVRIVRELTARLRRGEEIVRDGTRERQLSLPLEVPA